MTNLQVPYFDCVLQSSWPYLSTTPRQNKSPHLKIKVANQNLTLTSSIRKVKFQIQYYSISYIDMEGV